MKPKMLIILLILFLLFAASCRPAEDTEKSKKLHIIATIFPVFDFARNVGGDKVVVKMLLPPSTDAHNYELKPEEILKISKADLFLYINLEMEQWAHKALQNASVKTNMLPVEAGKGVTMLPSEEVHGDMDQENHHISKFDPHIWLDFDNVVKMVDNITAAFIEKDSANSDYYRNNAEEYKSKLLALDKRYLSELTGCRNKVVMHAGHRAFAYLCNRYGIKYFSTHTVSSDSEPEPQKIITFIRQINNSGTGYIYFEDLSAPRLAEVIAEETGAELLKLNNAHNISKKQLAEGISFLDLMEENLANLKKGMKCPQK